MMLYDADSVATYIGQRNAQSSIFNTIAGVYLMQENYEEAKKYYWKALKSGGQKIHDYVGLINVYVETDSLEKAKELLRLIPRGDIEYSYTIKRLSSLINRKEKHYEEALDDMEECLDAVDSMLTFESQSNVLQIEKKYNYLKAQETINELIINRQKYVIILSVCIIVTLFIVVASIIYKKYTNNQSQRQQREIAGMKDQLLCLSLDLEKKKMRLSTLERNGEDYLRMSNEIIGILSNYKKLQSKMVADSLLYKELKLLADQCIPQNDRPLIAKNQWAFIVKEIMGIYPDLYSYVFTRCASLSEQEWQYCCLCMFDFDTNEEAKLLNINPTSVKTKRHRLRQKLNLNIPYRMSFREYVTEQLCKFESTI